MRIHFRTIQSEDIAEIQDYWLNPANLAYHLKRGAEPEHIQRLIGQWGVLEKQAATPLAERTSSTAIVLLNGAPVGHSVLNEIYAPEKQRMHLHIWRGRIKFADLTGPRRMLNAAIPAALQHFFDNFSVMQITGEVAARNALFNLVLQRLGFRPRETVLTQYLSSTAEPYYRYIFGRKV